MESPNHGGAVARPSLGFPVGTAILLLVIFSLSGLFSCCYHWDKLRRRSYSSSAADAKSLHHQDSVIQKQNLCSLPVIMPGDDVPKFIALPCPCEPPRAAEIVIHVQKPASLPAPISAALAVPFY